MKLNIGCGEKLLDDAVNIDIREIDGAYQMDARELEFADETFSEVVAHDVIEHFTVDDALIVLSEIHRVLKPGSEVEFRLPDLASIFDAYAKGARAEKVSWWLYGGQDYKENFHLACYDKISFQNLLNNCEFQIISYVSEGTNMVVRGEKVSDPIKLEFKDPIKDFKEFCSSIGCTLSPQQEEIARLILGRDKVELCLSGRWGKNYMRDLIMKFEEKE